MEVYSTFSKVTKEALQENADVSKSRGTLSAVKLILKNIFFSRTRVCPHTPTHIYSLTVLVPFDQPDNLFRKRQRRIFFLP